eukprot:CAMPEP_0114605644 /NCGR_PEP_ID=MMETSP0168-20121206/1159_1 /TAXON_ID=95228 ORGANISM="Vannella sp., Strain DIVA3 517/6/12" /NCGR_SAMPLE_ID=MMETSP0168 /ASSEMBLY_ACC=CAM_ASM_000044 /LENGTH=171 /DNA_ID=CAMNT_0001816497 /DNA_START=206 /DNA_END=719 /DNA_ORIENTATION=-
MNLTWTVDSVPPSVAYLSSLRRLEIETANVIPSAIGTLPLLRQLVVKYTSPQHIPSEVGMLEQLRGLTLVGCSGHLPDELGSLTRLRELTLTDSRDATLPATLSQLLSLRRLEVTAANGDAGAPAAAKLEHASLCACSKDDVYHNDDMDGYMYDDDFDNCEDDYEVATAQM